MRFHLWLTAAALEQLLTGFILESAKQLTELHDPVSEDPDPDQRLCSKDPSQCSRIVSVKHGQDKGYTKNRRECTNEQCANISDKHTGYCSNLSQLTEWVPALKKHKLTDNN